VNDVAVSNFEIAMCAVFKADDTPSGSFSSNRLSAASALAKTLTIGRGLGFCPRHVGRGPANGRRYRAWDHTG
jgi:hypothetical protein